MGLGKHVDPAGIVTAIEGSLQRLGLEYVDIYYLLSVATREVALYEPYLKTFERLKRDGKTRFVGIGAHENEPEVIRAAAASAGLGVVAMKTQAGVYWDRMRLRKINMTAALKWVLSDENVHTAIPAFSTYDEMYADLAVMKDPILTDAERRDLKLSEDLGRLGHYCQQCGRCLTQCPAGMDVPTLMRCYMYACGHREPRKARAGAGVDELARLARAIRSSSARRRSSR